MRAPVPAAFPADDTCSSTQSGIIPRTIAYFTSICAAKCAGQANSVDLVYAQFVHQQAGAGVQRGLGQLNGPDIVLLDAHAGIADQYKP